MKTATIIALVLSILAFILLTIQMFEFVPEVSWAVNPKGARNFAYLINVISMGSGWIFYAVLITKQK